MNRFVLPAVLASVLTLVWVASAAAARPPARKQRQAKRHLKAASALFDAGRWDEAAARYQKAHALIRHPDIIWNIARCHEEKGDLPAAVQQFERFSGEKRISRARRRQVKWKLIELRRRIAALEEATPPEPETPPPEPPDSPQPGTAVTPRPSHPAPVVSRSGGPRTATWGWVTLGVGGALAVAGGVLVGLGKAEYAAIDEAAGSGVVKTGMTRAEALGRQDTGDRYVTTGWVLAGVGGAALVAAIVLVAVDGSDVSDDGHDSANPDRSGAGTRLEPLVTPLGGRGWVFGATARF